MLETIIDTSSVIALASMETAVRDPLNLHNAHLKSMYGGVQQAIEALVLYDRVVLDGPSFRRNMRRYPLLQRLLDDCEVLDLSEQDEIEIYEAVQQNHVTHMNPERPEWRNLISIDAEDWMCDEVGVTLGGGSSDWMDLTDRTKSIVANVAIAIQERLGENAPHSVAAFLQLVRFFYYMELQSRYSADLVLHPLREELLAEKRTGARIVGLFDEAAQTAFLERKKEWLGSSAPGFRAPLLAKYVLTRSTSWSGVVQRVLDLRRSREAKSFREGLSNLLESLRTNNAMEVDSTLRELDFASEAWNRGLDFKPGTKTRRIQLSVPMIGGDWNRHRDPYADAVEKTRDQNACLHPPAT